MSRHPWEVPAVVSGLRRQAADRDRTLAGSARHLGWKVGFGAPSALRSMDLDAPLLGHLTDATLLADGSKIDVSTWSRGVVEFEVAVTMAADVEPGASEGDARAAVGAVGPAIELADVDIAPGPDTIEDIVAGNIFHRGVVLGMPDHARAGIDTDALTARILVDGVERESVTDLEALTGSYPHIVVTVAETLGTIGERLRAGDVIITGSVIPPVDVDAGTSFRFLLGSFPPISIGLG